jgi:16S rRNA C967 or C1407 C5-methylase (RsmB/RsmF family)
MNSAIDKPTLTTNKSPSNKPKGILIGNDISLQRLTITKNLLKKYSTSKENNNIILTQEDARQIPIQISTKTLYKTKHDFIFTYKNTNPQRKPKGNPEMIPKKSKFKNDFLENKLSEPILFSKILVDVECSHDGSFKHVLKYIFNKEIEVKDKQVDLNGDISNKEKKRRMKQRLSSQFSKSNCVIGLGNCWSVEDFKERVLDFSRLESICQLQMDILENAISIVSVGGVVVYSTCTLSLKQNEEVIQKILLKYSPESSKYPFYMSLEPTLELTPELKSLGLIYSSLKPCLRINPGPNSASPMFISKLKKNAKTI